MKMNIIYMIMLTMYSRMLLKQADLLQSIYEIIDVEPDEPEVNKCTETITD